MDSLQKGSGDEAGGVRDLEKARKSFLSGDQKGSRDAHRYVVGEQGHQSQAATRFGSFYTTCVMSAEISLFSTSLLFSFLSELLVTSGDTTVARYVWAVFIFNSVLGLILGYLHFKNTRDRVLLEALERKREAWEMDNYPQGEVREMVALYTARGLEPHDALAAITILSKKKDFFIDLMMLEELEIAPYRGLPPPAEGLTYFFSFGLTSSVVLGAVALLSSDPLNSPISLFQHQLFLSLVTLAIVSLSIFKHHVFLEVLPWWQTSLQHLFVVGLVAYVAQSGSLTSLIAI